MEEKISKGFYNGKIIDFEKMNSEELDNFKVELKKQEQLLLNKLDKLISQL